MGKIISSVLSTYALLSSITLFAQSETLKLTEHIIEVTGSAEKSVTPDEFIFYINISERIENKVKITIEVQEAALISELKNIGIEVDKDLQVANIISAYIPKKRKADVYGNKNYSLKLTDLSKIEKLQQIADKINLERLDFGYSTHSEIAKFRKETKIEAIKAAKAKAEYMLEAIGEKVGKPILIQEIIDPEEYQKLRNRESSSLMSANAYSSYVGELKSGESLSFTKINLKYTVFAKFEIK